jgi:hypothetical protein
MQNRGEKISSNWELGIRFYIRIVISGAGIANFNIPKDLVVKNTTFPHKKHS